MDERCSLRSRNAGFAAPSFLFSRLPHFTFISCVHQTTFWKKKKTYGKVFRGTTSERGVSELKNLIIALKMNKLSAYEEPEMRTKNCTNTNNHRKIFSVWKKYRVSRKCAHQTRALLTWCESSPYFELRNGFAIQIPGSWMAVAC